MAYTATQADLNILRQGEQEIFLKVELLNSNFKVIDSLTGNIKSDTYSVDSESIQRRSYKADIVVTDDSFQIGRDKKIWLDKRIRVFYGVYSLRERQILWYRLGVFAYTTLNYSYSASERLLSVTCPDLMALYDGTLNGELSGYGSSHVGDTTQNITAHGLLIPAGEDMRQSIIATLKDAGITRYVIEDMNYVIPYDLEFDTGVTYADVWTKIRDLYDSWEFFFDVDGTFVWRKVPTCLEDPIALDNELMRSIVTETESTNVDFTGIYNVTEVWGKVLELSNSDRYAETSTYTDNVYHITLANLEKWSDIDNLTQIGIKICSDNLANPQFSVNDYSPIPIYDGNQKPLTAGVLKADTIYVFRYRRLNALDAETLEAGLFLLGQYQCHGIYEEKSADCPYSTTNLGYIIKRSVDYSNLSDDAACYNQAEYLTYKSTAMLDTISLKTLVIPWLDVNTKVEYVPYSLEDKNMDMRRAESKKKYQYIVKSFSWSTGDGTMSLVLYRFSEDFSFVYNKKNNTTTR